MGDRGNVVFRSKPSTVAETSLRAWLEGNIVLYTHNGGSDLPADLAAGLHAAMPRWGDEGYATRIITSRIIGAQWRQETGFGLYVGELGDNQHNLLVVNWYDKTIQSVSEAGVLINTLSFTDYLALSHEALAEFHEPNSNED